MENRSIKNRLFQTLMNKSPKHPFLLEDDKSNLSSVLKPKKMQEDPTPKNAKTQPIYKSGKLLLNQISSPEIYKKKPMEVSHQKLSLQAKSIVEEGKNRLRTNLKPHDIFQLYESFPEMLQDFFYLNRLSHPYDYQIVTYAERNPQEYMTISSQGITLYHDKEAEFLTKEQWLIDEKRYFSLQKIYFFKQYKLCKNFRIWKNRMRRHYMKEMSSILSENLFLTIKFPRNCLLQVKYYTNSLKDSLNFFPFDNMQRLNPHEFEALMADYRHKSLLKGIKQITAQITASLQSAVAQEINKFKAENNIKIQSVNQKQSSNKQGYIYSQEAILRKQYKRVYKLIKLADSMLQEAKIQMVLRCLKQLTDKIKQLQNEDRQPWIICTASIQEDGAVHWQPNCASLCEVFMKAIKNHINCLNEHNEKIINNPAFSKYKQADCGQSKIQQSKNSVKLMIQESPSYYVLLSEIEESLVSQFNQTERQEGLLQNFINIYLRHKDLSSMAEIFKTNNGVELCNYVDQWKKDEKQMHQLNEEKKGRLILYNYSQLRKKIINTPKLSLNSFFSLLPEETLTRCKELISQSKSLLDLISIYPTQIVSFAKFNKAVKQASERLENIRSSGSQICLLIDLMTKNKLSNIQIYNAKKIQALNSINTLKNKVDQSEAKQNESLSKFKKDNEVEVVKIKTMVKEFGLKFNTIQFNQTKVSTKEMKDILGKLREILPSINSLEMQSLKIQEIQIDLNLNQTDFSEVHRLYENVKIVNEIWTCRDDWKTMLINLYHKHYCDVDCVEIKSKWELFFSQVNNLIKQLPDSEILKNLATELSEVQILIDTIIALRSPNLEQKSWKQISEYLAYELGIQDEAQLPFSNIKNPSYTVKWLLEINIPIYKEKIQFIVRKSEKQKELIIHLSEFKNYITNLVFDLVSKKREVYFFAKNKSAQEKIHEHLTQLYSMLDNQYSQCIKNEAQNLIRHYEYIEEIMIAVIEFGNIWNKYESFFDGNSGSLKLLTKESKEFANWQIQWKKIIKNITTDSAIFYKKICDETTGVNCSRSTMKQITKINITIDQVKKGLDQYLEKKRSSFPRYYFLPDQQLLNMLANVDQKEPITAFFVPIIYKNIERILYKQDTNYTLLGIISKQGEQFGIRPVSFKLQAQMQDNFKHTEEHIKKQLIHLIRSVFVRYTDEQITRQKMILQNNTQVALTIDLIAWVRLAQETYLCTEPLGDLYDWIEIQLSQIKQLASLMNSTNPDHIKFKLMQLMSQSIYLRQKTDHLLKLNVSTTQCYQWEKLPKLFMSNNNGDIYLKQLNNKLNYCYQFLGNKAVSFILPQTQRSWLSLTQAIAAKEVVCLENNDGGKLEIVRQLGYLIGQQVQYAHLSEKASFKMIQRYINGAVFTGNWTCFNHPNSTELLSFLANQINHVRKVITDNNMQKAKSSLIFNSNVSFFLCKSIQNPCLIDRLIVPLSHRNITLTKPNLSKIFTIITESLGLQQEIGSKTVKICDVLKQTFQNSYVYDFNRQFYVEILNKTIDLKNKYEWLKNLKCKQFYQYLICEAIDSILLPFLKKDELKAYEHVKNCIIPDYQKIKLRHPVPKSTPNTEISAFLQQKKLGFLKKSDFIEQFQSFEKAVLSNNLGIIIHGESLSGKSTLIDLVARKLNIKNEIKIKQHRIYHNAYKKEEILLTEKNNSIFTEIMNESSSINWVIFDGQISSNYLEIFGNRASKYIIPQIGTLTSGDKFKFISETNDISSLSPSIIGNHSIIFFSDILSTELIIRKLFSKLEQKGYLVNLQRQTIQWLLSGFVSILTKLQNKSLLKSKLINFIYPLNIWQITQRCCRLVEAIFIMNWESIRQKQKIKKSYDRFILWSVYWSLIGVIATEDEVKLEKLIGQIGKSQTCNSEQFENSMIYPGCGLQVQQINGLRTQSSLGIPEKGIITNLLRSDLTSEADSSRGNKFYEQIVISEANVIRVNHHESNKFSYISQLSFLTETPVILLGAPNTGKKSIIELFVKNMKNKTQFYSIRYLNRDTLGTQIEHPFRKLIALQGIVLKSMSASKKLIISIEDVYLNYQHRDTSEMLRMLFSQKGYYNKQAQWMRVTNCFFDLIVNKLTINSDTLRLLSKVNIFQTANNSTEKLYSIYSPYLKNWCTFNGMGGQVERIFNSDNGDTLLDATLSVYKLMQQMHKTEFQKGSLQSLLLKPRIGDITKILSYICRTPDANHYNITYYYQLWTHQVVRVFGDRICAHRQKQLLFKEIKKQALVKFKENFNLNASNMFSFTSLGIENENCYIRIEDPTYLHTYISNLLEADQINLPLKYLFDELLQNLIKIYRIMAIQGSHILILSQNNATAQYLIQLACQVGQNDCFKLKGQPINAQKHIQPTLYYKNNTCFSQNIDQISKDTTYQLACLLNYNAYDFNLKTEIKQKIKVSLYKKEKVEPEKQKKQTKIFTKSKQETNKTEQKQQDFEASMVEQFMNYAHFILHAQPFSNTLKQFILQQNDIVGQLHFSWVDIPKEAVVKVAKQILSFDQQACQMVVDVNSDDRLIEKSSIIYSDNKCSESYFNELLTICEVVKSEEVRLSMPLKNKQDQLKESKLNMSKVINLVKQKQQMMKNIQEELQETNISLQQKCKQLEQINNKITQWQMNTTNGEEMTSEGLSNLRVQREEIQIELKFVKDIKEKLQPEKKKILKNIKIATDYLDIFNNSTEIFDQQEKSTDNSLNILQDKLIIAWSIVSYLSKKPYSSWLPKINNWISQINSKLTITNEADVLKLLQSISPTTVVRSDLFSDEIRSKMQILILMLHNYQEIVAYGRIVKVYDPKGILATIFDHLSYENTNSFCLLRKIPQYNRESRGQIQTLCKQKNGIILLESSKNVQQLQIFFTDKKMVSYLNKFVVLSTKEEADLIFQCNNQQLRLSIQNFVLKEINQSLCQEKSILFRDLSKELKKKEQNEEYFIKACASINIETQTYTEEINKYTNALKVIDDNIAHFKSQAYRKDYLECPQFEMLDAIYQSLVQFWQRREVNFKHIAYLYNQSIYLRNHGDFQEISFEEKQKLLQLITKVNLGNIEGQSLETYLKYSRKWDNRVKILLVDPENASLEKLESNKQFKSINLLSSNIASQTNQNSSIPKMLYNFIPDLHTNCLNDIIQRQINDADENKLPVLLLIAERAQLSGLCQKNILVISLKLEDQPCQVDNQIKVQTKKNLENIIVYNNFMYKDHAKNILDLIEKNISLAKTQEQLVHLLSDFMPNQSTTSIHYLLNCTASELSDYLKRISEAKQETLQKSNDSSKNMQQNNPKQEIPFLFNISQFMPSKDPLATEFVAECIQYNKKLRELKQKLRQPQFEWEEIEQFSIQNDQIIALNQQYLNLKRNLIKFHILPGNTGLNNTKSSHKLLNSLGVLFQNSIKLPQRMINCRMINLLRCKAAKKYKCGLSNIHFVWKLCTSSFSFEQNFTSPQLSIIVSCTIKNGKLFKTSWTQINEGQQKIYLIGFAVESPHEFKTNSQATYIPLNIKDRQIGQLEVNKCELPAQYIIGIEHPNICIEEEDF